MLIYTPRISVSTASMAGSMQLVLSLIGLFILVVARPQSEPDNSLSAQEGTVAIEESEYDGSEFDYNRLGDYQVCGFSSKTIARVSPGGGQAKRRDYPWMAVILRKSDNFHFCGGVIITPRHIITASHCIYNLKKEDILVRLGEYDFTKEEETKNQDYAVVGIKNHEDWDPSTYENDIAILLIEKKAKYDLFVQPVCLPSPLADFTNTTAVVAGWGTTTYGGPMSDILLEVAVPVWEQEKCASSFTQTIFSTVQCAASYDGGKDSCQGDSGGPLLSQRDDGRWITIGIVSWGIRCGEKGKPGVYTRVSNYLEWIAPRIRDV